MLDRRVFLQRSWIAAVSTVAAGGGSGLDRSVLGGIEPIKRTGRPKFKYSLAAYSYRDLLTHPDAKLTLFDFLDDCAAMGLEGTELTSYYFPQEVSNDYLRDLKKRCFELGLDVSGTAVGNDFGVADEARYRSEIAAVKDWIDKAEILGAPVIRIFAGHVPDNEPFEIAYRRMIVGIEECCDYAGKHGVFLALENHGGPTATAEGLLAFVRDVSSPWFGVNFDSGNFHSPDVYRELEQIAPYALNVQIKVTTSGSDRQKQPSDYARLGKMLHDVGYRGYIVLEFEEQGDPRVECPKILNELREVFDRLELG